MLETTLHKSEAIKYNQRWQGNYRSASAIPFADEVLRYTEGRGTHLELGCGDGTTIRLLRAKGVTVQGVDITLLGCGGLDGVTRAAVWDLRQFKDGAFDWTYSTDVLEHLPPQMVERAISEIVRVTRCGTLHQIATFAMGDDHLTVQPVTWWREQFDRYAHLAHRIIERSL